MKILNTKNLQKTYTSYCLDTSLNNFFIFSTINSQNGILANASFTHNQISGFVKGTFIWVKHKNKIKMVNIKILIEKYTSDKEIHITDLNILGYDFNNQKTKFANIIGCMMRYDTNQDWITIELENNETITCTKNQEFAIKENRMPEWIFSRYLEKNENIFTIENIY